MATFEQTLYALEQKLARSTARNDEQFLNNTLADNFTEFSSSGRIFKKAAIIALLTNENSFADYMIENFNVEIIASDTALVTYEIPARTLADGPQKAATLRSSIWKRADGDKWQILFHQGTLRP